MTATTAHPQPGGQDAAHTPGSKEGSCQRRARKCPSGTEGHCAVRSRKPQPFVTGRAEHRAEELAQGRVSLSHGEPCGADGTVGGGSSPGLTQLSTGEVAAVLSAPRRRGPAGTARLLSTLLAVGAVPGAAVTWSRLRGFSAHARGGPGATPRPRISLCGA